MSDLTQPFFLFTTNGVLLATFTSPTPESFSAFGLTIAAVDPAHVLVAASLYDYETGRAYLFDVPGPPLELARTNGNVCISWPSPATGFVLERALSLAEARTAAWTTPPSHTQPMQPIFSSPTGNENTFYLLRNLDATNQ